MEDFLFLKCNQQIHKSLLLYCYLESMAFTVSPTNFATKHFTFSLKCNISVSSSFSQFLQQRLKYTHSSWTLIISISDNNLREPPKVTHTLLVFILNYSKCVPIYLYDIVCMYLLLINSHSIDVKG